MVLFEVFEDGLTGRFLMHRGRLWGEAASFFGLNGQGFGDGVAAQPALRRYGRLLPAWHFLGVVRDRRI